MSLLDQYNLSTNPAFVQRVQASIVHAALAVASEVANDVQTVSVSGSPTGGTFTLSGGPLSSTVSLNWNSTAAAAQTAIAANAGVGAGNVVVTGGPLPATALVVTFAGTLGNAPQNVMTVGTNSLTGGSSPTPSVAHTTVGVAVVGHAARQALATKILNSPQGYATLMAIGVSDNATVQGDFPGPSYALGVTEAAAGNDIQFQVNSIFGAYT